MDPTQYYYDPPITKVKTVSESPKNKEDGIVSNGISNNKGIWSHISHGLWGSLLPTHKVIYGNIYGTLLEQIKDMPNLKINQVKLNENISALCAPNDLISLFKNSDSKNSIYPGVYNWEGVSEKDFAFGQAFSLYEKDLTSNSLTGDPLADALTIVSYQSCSILSLADGVSWGKKSKLSSNCAVYGATIYLCNYIDRCNTTKDVFKCIWDSFKRAQEEIVKKEATLTTLCVGVVVKLQEKKDRWAFCVINVGDSYAYFYNRKTGVREVTCGSHPIDQERDMRYSGGSLGPADGYNPDLGNLTCSFVIIEKDDIVFLCSDGISDNYDPAVAMFNPKTDSQFNGVNLHNPIKLKNNDHSDNQSNYQSKIDKIKKLIKRYKSKLDQNESENIPYKTSTNDKNNHYFPSSSEIYYSCENIESQQYFIEHSKVLSNTPELSNTYCYHYKETATSNKTICTQQNIFEDSLCNKQKQTEFDLQKPPYKKESNLGKNISESPPIVLSNISESPPKVLGNISESLPKVFYSNSDIELQTFLPNPILNNFINEHTDNIVIESKEINFDLEKNFVNKENESEIKNTISSFIIPNTISSTQNCQLKKLQRISEVVKDSIDINKSSTSIVVLEESRLEKNGNLDEFPLTYLTTVNDNLEITSKIVASKSNTELETFVPNPVLNIFRNEHTDNIIIENTEYTDLKKNKINNESESKIESNSLHIIPGTIFLTPQDRQIGILQRMTEVIIGKLAGDSMGDHTNEEVISAMEVCARITNFVIKRTQQKRRILQEISPHEKKDRCIITKILEDVPGKLDHAAIVAYQVGLHCKNIFVEKPNISARKSSCSVNLLRIPNNNDDLLRRKSLGDI